MSMHRTPKGGIDHQHKCGAIHIHMVYWRSCWPSVTKQYRRVSCRIAHRTLVQFSLVWSEWRGDGSCPPMERGGELYESSAIDMEQTLEMMHPFQNHCSYKAAFHPNHARFPGAVRSHWSLYCGSWAREWNTIQKYTQIWYTYATKHHIAHVKPPLHQTGKEI